MADFWRVVFGTDTSQSQSSSSKHERREQVRAFEGSHRPTRKRGQDSGSGSTHAAAALSRKDPAAGTPQHADSVRDFPTASSSHLNREQCGRRTQPAPFEVRDARWSRTVTVFRKTRQIPRHATEHLSFQSRAHASERCQARLTVFHAHPPPRRPYETPDKKRALEVRLVREVQVLNLKSFFWQGA